MRALEIHRSVLALGCCLVLATSGRAEAPATPAGAPTPWFEAYCVPPKDEGPDETHWDSEVTSPRAAFAKALSTFDSNTYQGSGLQDIQIEQESPVRGVLWAQHGSKKPGTRCSVWVQGVYCAIEPADETLADGLATEARVGHVLAEIGKLPAGRDAVRVAASRYAPGDCPALPQVLAKYLERNPATRDQVKAILRSSVRSQPRDEDLESALAGRMPGGAATDDLPRPRDYVPTEYLRRIGIEPDQHQTVYRGDYWDGGWWLEIVRKGEKRAEAEAGEPPEAVAGLVPTRISPDESATEQQGAVALLGQ